MKVENYSVRWVYPRQTKRERKAQKTFCVIEANNIEIGIGETKCMKTDKFDKEFARRKSLARALEAANVTDNNISKEERAEIWNAYRHLTATPRW
jgi:hypothetical protein